METLDNLNDEIYVSLKKFCEIKNISKITFWRRRKKNNFPCKIVKLKGYGKKLFILIKKDDIVFLDKDNKFVM